MTSDDFKFTTIKKFCCQIQGRFVFGNRLTPTTLSICVEEAHCVYSTKPAVSRLDHFMHFVKAKADNAKILLAPSPKYTGLVDDPPRYMGEGFVVMMSNLVELYFYMDEPGLFNINLVCFAVLSVHLLLKVLYLKSLCFSHWPMVMLLKHLHRFGASI